MKIKVSVYATLREKLGWKSKEVEVKENTTVRDVLEKLPDLSGKVLNKSGELVEGMVVLLNGLNIKGLEGLNTKVKDGDEIDIFPPAGGG